METRPMPSKAVMLFLLMNISLSLCGENCHAS
ncbi:Uncharacterised protein [Vibrio cholerae]|nr:Uncharacterised protein [Vibrio cholerae]CSI80383.1 Uncharacterised protein [Vibrio cholerae]